MNLAWLQGRRRLEPLLSSTPLRKTESVSRKQNSVSPLILLECRIALNQAVELRNDRSHRTCSPPKRFVNFPWPVHMTPAIPDIQTSLGRDGKCLSHPELLEPRPGGKCRTGKAQNRAAFTPILFHPKEAFCEGKK